MRLGACQRNGHRRRYTTRHGVLAVRAAHPSPAFTIESKQRRGFEPDRQRSRDLASAAIGGKSEAEAETQAEVSPTSRSMLFLNARTHPFCLTVQSPPSHHNRATHSSRAPKRRVKATNNRTNARRVLHPALNGLDWLCARRRRHAHLRSHHHPSLSKAKGIKLRRLRLRLCQTSSGLLPHRTRCTLRIPRILIRTDGPSTAQ